MKDKAARYIVDTSAAEEVTGLLSNIKLVDFGFACCFSGAGPGQGTFGLGLFLHAINKLNSTNVSNR
jgi:hypothetical protein